MIIPELPAYLSSMGGEDYKGFIISVFTLTAGLSRPFSGKLTDTIGRIPVMIFGTLVCVVCSLIYPFVATVAAFLVLRFFHGLSTGFKPTASSAYVADVVPLLRRGEAMGVLGVSMGVGASSAPILGSYLAQVFSLDVMFYLSSLMALLSILILLGLKETLGEPRPFRPAMLKIGRNDVFEPRVLPPAIVILLSYTCYGALLTIVPDQSDYLGISNKGLFFATYTASSMLSRVVAGKISDRIGRVPVLKLALVLSTLSLIGMGLSFNALTLLVASGCLGFALGITIPAVFAWVIDLSQDHQRGRAMATAYIALEISIGAGALISAWLYGNNPVHFQMTFFVFAGAQVLAGGYLFFYGSTKPAS